MMTRMDTKWPYKTGDPLKEVKFICNFHTGQEKGDLLIQMTAWAGFTVIYSDNVLKLNICHLFLQTFMYSIH